MHVLNELKNRGVDDILITCVDGLKGFPDAIKTIFPRTEVQVCVVHQIRHTLMFISHKDKKKFAEHLKTVYTANTEDAGLQALKEMEKNWPQYSSYLKSWEDRWSDISPFFAYPQAIKRIIYTTNTIENLNRQFRKATKTTQVFPHDDSLLKLLWLAQADFTEAWHITSRNWGEVMAQFGILFPDRIKF
jgi:putative transposase